MRKAEEIKKGLECCDRTNLHSTVAVCCKCPYSKVDGCLHSLIRDAFALIQQLEAQTPKWISVEERVPENDDDVLIVTEFGMSMGYYDIYRDYWLDYTNTDSNIVTHWMPLPEPPKEGWYENCM